MLSRLIRLLVIALLVIATSTAANAQLSEPRLVKDICTVENSLRTNFSHLTSDSSGLYFFTRHDTSSIELWYSDGTKSGTNRVKKIELTHTLYGPSNIQYVDSLLYFTLVDDSNYSTIWRSNGTPEGTHAIVDNNQEKICIEGPFYDLTIVDNSVYYLIDDNILKRSIMRYDLFTHKLSQVDFLEFPFYPCSLVNTDLGLIVISYSKPYTKFILLDPVSKETSPLVTPDSFELNSIYEIIPAQNSFYFSSRTSSNRNESLFRYDILTQKLIQYTSPTNDPRYLDYNFEFTLSNDSLFFVAENMGKKDIWMACSANDTLTRVCKVGITSNVNEPEILIVSNGSLFFTTSRAFPGKYKEFWVVDLQTLSLQNINPQTQDSVRVNDYAFTISNSKIFFSGYHEEFGSELFYYDLSTDTTHIVQDVSVGQRGSLIHNIKTIGNNIFTLSHDAILGTELGVVDATTPTKHTWLTLTDQIPGSSNPSFISSNGKKMYYRANNITDGTQLWETDIETESTKPIDFKPEQYYGYYPYELTHINDHSYFICYLSEYASRVIVRILPNGKAQVITPPNDSDYIRSIRGYNDALIITTQHADTRVESLFILKNDMLGLELVDQSDYRFNIHEGAFLGNKFYYSVRNVLYELDLNNHKSKRSGIVTVNVAVYRPILTSGHRLYFTAYDHTKNNGTECWLSDGTKSGTRMIYDLSPGPESSIISNLTPFGNNIGFIRTSDNGVLEVWAYNPKDVEPVLIKMGNSFSLSTTDVESESLFISGINIFGGQNLWCYNGTTSKTELLHSLIEPQRQVGQYASFINGWYYYLNTSANFESTLYQTDGTKQGTSSIYTWKPDGTINNPKYLVFANQKLFFSGYQLETGRELFVADLPDYSVNEINKMKVVPNPVVDEVKLYAEGRLAGTKTDIDVYNITGQKVFKSKSIENPIHLNLEFLTPGIYIIRLSTGESTKFVKY